MKVRTVKQETKLQHDEHYRAHYSHCAENVYGSLKVITITIAIYLLYLKCVS